MSYLLSAYGISVRHPEEWRVYINPNRSFTPERGFLKIDNTEKDISRQVSCSLTWETAEVVEEGFAERYMEQIQIQYEKSLKSDKRYRIFDKRIIKQNGHDACFVHSTVASSTHIFRAIGKNVNLQLLQLALYCPKTNKIVVETITATSTYVDENMGVLKKMLLSLSCHGEDNVEPGGERLC